MIHRIQLHLVKDYLTKEIEYQDRYTCSQHVDRWINDEEYVRNYFDNEEPSTENMTQDDNDLLFSYITDEEDLWQE
ncbi:MAG: hypothetical protein KAG37_04020 [Flavobacteriales bacterium]|nr:hypothetical protein [Flavobacteriales bacterium]